MMHKRNFTCQWWSIGKYYCKRCISKSTLNIKLYRCYNMECTIQSFSQVHCSCICDTWVGGRGGEGGKLALSFPLVALGSLYRISFRPFAEDDEAQTRSVHDIDTTMAYSSRSPRHKWTCVRVDVEYITCELYPGINTYSSSCMHIHTWCQKWQKIYEWNASVIRSHLSSGEKEKIWACWNVCNVNQIMTVKRNGMEMLQTTV